MSSEIKMETVSDGAKKALVSVLNEAIQMEYEFIINYPRILDYLTMIEKITDKMFLTDLEKLGKDSIRHLGLDVDIIKSLGGEPNWSISHFEKMFNAHEQGVKQLENEKKAFELYKDAINIVRSNTVNVKAEKDTSGKYYRYNKRGFADEVRSSSELITILEKIDAQEITHIKVVENLLATYDYLASNRQ